MRRAFITRRGGISVSQLILLVLLLLIVALFILPHPHKVYPVDVRQKAQLHSIEAGLELCDSQFNGYPPSNANDVTGLPYCGAMKLAEAMMGQDEMGFHPKSTFRADGLDPNAHTRLYVADTLRDRPGPFLPLENANLYRLVDVYGKGKTGPFPEDTYVLCDTYAKKRPSGKKVGMPILYYCADTSGTSHDANNPDNPGNIYDYRDNLVLITLGVPGDPSAVHPLTDPRRFYLNTQNTQVAEPAPYRRDSYLLISAGWDGLYGTADDICNFEWWYRER